MNENTKIKFSIIVVSLNTKNFFLETIDSIINQSFNNYEIIVVDGFSEDGTKDEILKKKKYFSHFIIERDKGIYDAMNKGIKLAQGEWSIFLNSGDKFFDNSLLSQINEVDIKKYDIIHGNTVIKNNFLSYISKSKNFNRKTLLMPFCHQSCFIKTNIMKENMFNLDYFLSSDFNLFHQLYLQKRVFHKIDKFISIVIAGGLADREREKVFNENQTILKQKYNKNYFLYFSLYRIYYSINKLIKFFLPTKIWFLILRIKYRKRIIK